MEKDYTLRNVVSSERHPSDKGNQRPPVADLPSRPGRCDRCSYTARLFCGSNLLIGLHYSFGRRSSVSCHFTASRAQSAATGRTSLLKNPFVFSSCVRFATKGENCPYKGFSSAFSLIRILALSVSVETHPDLACLVCIAPLSLYFFRPYPPP